MDITEQEIEAPPAGARRRRRMRALGTGAATLLVAATLAACGGDDSSSDETTAASGTTAAQADTTAATDTGEDNGVAELSADEILEAARDAALGATAVHVAGDAGGTMLDLSLVRGEGGSGRIADQGNEFEIIAVGGSAYLQAGDRFWEQFGGRAAAQLLSGKWLRVGADDENFGSFAQLTDMSTLVGQALRPEGDDAITKGDVEERDGQQVIALRSDRGTLFVATTGEPFPVAIEQEGVDGGAITFDEWNEPTDLSAPEDAIDVGELQSLRTN